MKLVGIDIGYINMGVVSAELDDNCNLRFFDAFRYNISLIKQSAITKLPTIIDSFNVILMKLVGI